MAVCILRLRLAVQYFSTASVIVIVAPLMDDGFMYMHSCAFMYRELWTYIFSTRVALYRLMSSPCIHIWKEAVSINHSVIRVNQPWNVLAFLAATLWLKRLIPLKALMQISLCVANVNCCFKKAQDPCVFASHLKKWIVQVKSSPVALTVSPKGRHFCTFRMPICCFDTLCSCWINK